MNTKHQNRSVTRFAQKQSQAPWLWAAMFAATAIGSAQAQFVEGDVVVIHQLPPAPIGGTFGWAVAELTDIDNPSDGVLDLISGAPGANRVLVYSGATGALIHDIPGPTGATNLGYSIADAGDVNNDGVNDIIAGAPGPSFGSNPGFAAVFSGVDGSVIWSWTGEAALDAFGAAVAGIDDVNGDNHADVLVGAPGNDGAANSAGRCYLYSGIDGTEIRQFDGPSSGASFGSGTAGTRDLDGDLIGDLIIGAPGDGKAFVYSGSDGSLLFDTTADPGNSSYGTFFVAGVGDVSNDGNNDVYVGDFGHGGGVGRAYVYSGIDGAVIHVFPGSTGTGPGRGAGDVNDDGYADLIIGDWTSSAGAPGAGRVRVYSGRTGAVLRTITSTTNGENLGFDAVGVGDVNGDSIIDLMLSAATGNTVYVIEGIEISCPLLDPAEPEPAAPAYNRYLAFSGGNAGESTAVRVTLTALDGFPGANGQQRWVGPPSNAPNGSLAGTPIRVAQLQCTPHYRDWGAEGVVYVYGAEVVPGSTYDIQLIAEECATTIEENFTSPLALTNQKWGDVAPPFGGASQPNFGDITALVEAFKQIEGAILKPQAQLQPNIPNPQLAINFADITADVEAFKGNEYPYAGPGSCP